MRLETNVRNRGKETRVLRYRHQEGCFFLVIMENCEGKVGLVFCLLSYKIDWTALSFVGRAMSLAKNKSSNLWHPGDFVFTSRSLLDVKPLPCKHKGICFSKMSLWAADKFRQWEIWQALCEVSRLLVLGNSTRVLWHSCTKLAATSLGRDRWLYPPNPHQQLTPGSLWCITQTHDCTRSVYCLYPGYFCSYNPRSVRIAFRYYLHYNLPFLLLASIVVTLEGDKDPNENHGGTI